MKDLHPEILDLLALRATEGISEEQERKLERLLEDHGLEDTLELDLAAAAASNAFALQQVTANHQAPDALKIKLKDDASNFFAKPEVVDISTARDTRSRPTFNYGWAVAAMLAVALISSVTLNREPDLASPGELREQLLAADRNVEQLEWAPSEFTEYEGVEGDVIWSDERQEGYMLLTNMPANDPGVSQYQLWIVDPDRDANPVDGGVFDVPADSTSVVVPIRAKLSVDKPVAFAITREQPGGVVVSEGPLLIVASTG